jgi:GT2 family glycosyltransferase
MSAVTVTVVVATRDRAASLRHTLDRITATGVPVIVVDNGSSDRTAHLVRRHFPDVRLVRLSRNRGAQARNIGVRLARTPYVAFSDDDSWWAPGALERAAERFDACPRLGLIAGRTLVGTDERLDPVAARMAEAPLGHADDLPGPSILGFLACAAVVRRTAFIECGGFDRVVFFRGEEARLAYDLHAAGWGLAYCADIVAHHHPAPRPADGRGDRLAARNHALTAWMRRPLPVAVAATAQMDGRGLADVLFRLPFALLHRRAPDGRTEAALGRLADDQATGDVAEVGAPSARPPRRVRAHPGPPGRLSESAGDRARLPAVRDGRT